MSNVSVLSSNDSSSQNQTNQIVRTGTLLLCMTVGVFTNIICVVTISKSRALYRRSLFGLCINLDCIFFLDIFLNQSLTVIASIEDKWIFNDSMCIAQSFSVHVVDTCLSLTLFLLSIDRLVAVRGSTDGEPKHAKGLTKDSVSLSIVCLWLMSVCVSIPLVTNTIPSQFILTQLACLPQLRYNLIYFLANCVLTMGVPLCAAACIYAYVAVLWRRQRRLAAPSPLPSPLAVEESSAGLGAILHGLWLAVVGPYVVWVHTPFFGGDPAASPSPAAATAVTWMRHFFCCLPFLAVTLHHSVFRRTLASVFIGHKYRSSAAAAVPPLSLPQHNDASFTNNAFQPSSSFSSFSSSLSRSSSVRRPINQQPQFPILFADGSGIHVIHNNRIDCTSFSSSTREAAVLCDVRQSSFTDTSDAVSMTTQEGSFKQSNKIQRNSRDVKLPADITDLYSTDHPRIKRTKRKPNSRQKSLRTNIESAFEHRDPSSSNKVAKIQSDSTPPMPKTLPMIGQLNSRLPVTEHPEVIRTSIRSRDVNSIEDSSDNCSFVLDYAGSKNP